MSESDPRSVLTTLDNVKKASTEFTNKKVKVKDPSHTRRGRTMGVYDGSDSWNGIRVDGPGRPD